MVSTTQFWDYLFGFIACVIVLSACSHSKTHSLEEEALSSPSKPNIIYILADDLGYGDLSCYGQQKFRTPNIDRLAADGMRFTRHYAGSTVCAPSRSVLMTGLHTGHTFIRGNKEVQPEGQYPLPDSIQTLPEVLQQAGYVTGAFGKWGLGYPGSAGDPVRQGFDEFFGYNCQRLAHHYYPYYLWHNNEKVMLEGNKGQAKATYAPAMIQQQALMFIEEHKDTRFFMFVPTPIPHAELAAPKAYMKKFEGKLASAKPYKGYDEGPDYRQGPYASQPHPHAAYAAMITYLDVQVGEIRAKLKALGLEKNTLLIFSSDNGPAQEGGADPAFFHSNGPFRGIKRDVYEGGIRVPMIACWPGHIRAGSVSNHVSAFWDIMPTLAEVAGTSPDKPGDGISFLPTLLHEEGQQQHDYLYWECFGQGGKQALRKNQWKAVKLNVREHPNRPLALYDLSVDTGEQHNVALQHPEVVKALNALLQEAHVPSAVFPLLPGEEDSTIQVF